LSLNQAFGSRFFKIFYQSVLTRIYPALFFGMDRYYSNKLPAEKLRRCYQIAPPRIMQYMNAEINHVMDNIAPGSTVLEMGCGYGRVMRHLCRKAQVVVGIDTAFQSLKLAQVELKSFNNWRLLQMDAVQTGLCDRSFDLVICIQNGISAFKVDQFSLISESVRLTCPGGNILFSSYSENIWNERLEWFRKQADAGLLGEVDHEQTGDGVIVCRDGFRATTIRVEEFKALAGQAGFQAEVYEIDNSSIFYKISVPGR
jgi:2-polyprenyl-6-hydroxyphenyl methylase/3-demethylubiquinone-9 3-methyltransferase